MKVITFSRYFPPYHPKAGQPTFFAEKIWAHLLISGQHTADECYDMVSGHWDRGIVDLDKVTEFIGAGTPKIHTIRAGNRWREGDRFSARVWAGRPRRSKQIIFAPPLTILKTEEIGTVDYATDKKQKDIRFWKRSDQTRNGVTLKRTLFQKEAEIIARNDGLEYDDFRAWFSRSEGYTGQIIHF